jgi:O-antigen ligase/polysaccharide polymerase Wzy-like membrane protein
VRSLAAALNGAPRGRRLALPIGVTPGTLVLAAALPIVFLHLRYQPSVGIGRATFKLSDAAVLLAAAAAAATAVRRGLAPLRPGIPVWVTGAALLVWVGAAVFYPLLSSHAYAWKTHLVTAGEFGEYALLAPAVPLLVRRRADGLLALGTLVAWSVVATVVGVLQWAGWNIAAGWGQGRREPSFLGTHDFAALAGMTLGVGIVALLWGVAGRLRSVAWLAVVTGVVGIVLGGATSGVAGLVAAAVIAVVVAARRRLVRRAALVGTVAATLAGTLGVVALRSGDFGQFFSFLGVRHASAAAAKNIETYPQHTVLAYIGLRIWLHHPIVGAGFEASKEYSTYGPELPAAHERFPHVSALSFPSRTRSYGIQDLYIQALADLGVIGFLLLVALFGAGIWLGLASAFRAPPVTSFAALLGVFWLVMSLGFWGTQDFVAGIPTDAVTWLALGTAVTRFYGAEA